MRATVYLYVGWYTRKYCLSLYTLYAATTAGLSVFCRNKRRAPRQAAVRANHKRSRLEGTRSERSEARRSVIACRGAARVSGRQGVDRLVVCFRGRSAKQLSRNHKRNKPAESPFRSLVPLRHAADRLASCMLWGKAAICAAPDILHAHTIYCTRDTCRADH